MTTNEPFLEESLERLEKVRAWSPHVISKLETLIHDADDEALLRINPFRFAFDKSIKEPECLDLFLHASLQGLFTMDWSLTCPTCGEVVESFKTLQNIHANFGCNLCRTNIATTLDDIIHVSFTVSPRVREIIFHRPESLSAEDYYLKYRFDQQAHYPGGSRFVDEFRKEMLFLATIPMGKSAAFDIDLSPGWFITADLENDAGCFLEARQQAGAVNEPLRVQLRRNARLTELPARAVGKLHVELTNMTAVPSRVFGLLEPSGKKTPPLEFDHVLTGKRILGTQTFRDLFRNQVISSNEGLTVRDITILFTDLKGSTALYDRIGDLKAFNLVQAHFDSLGKVISGHGGAIVKTIGDAIMASFLSPLDAAGAALAMLEEIERFNDNLGRREIVLKMGIHRGASIAVTLNDRVDYFGQMVNVASRVQGVADADQICLTEEVFSAEGVQEVFREQIISRESSAIKGVQGEMLIYRVQPYTKGAV